MQEKRTLPVKQVLADIRSGMSPDDLMGKYGLSTKSLQGLFKKLTESGLLSKDEIGQWSSTQECPPNGSKSTQGQDPEAPLESKGANQPPLSQVLADIRAGANFQQLMQKYNFPAESLQKILAKMLFEGLLEPAEAAKLRPPPKSGSNMPGISPTAESPTSQKISKVKAKEINWRRIKVWAAVLPIIIVLIAGGAYGVWYYMNVKEKQERLIRACTFGDVDETALLLSEGTDTNTTDQHGDSALVVVCSKGYLEVANLLLKKGADPNFRPKHQGSMTLGGRLKRIFGKSDPEANTQHGDSPLMVAVSAGHVQIVELLLDKGAEIEETDTDGNTSLMKAARTGHLDVVQLLLRKNANANRTNSNGDTALILAAGEGHVDIASSLLKKGAAANSENDSGETALDVAYDRGQATIEALLKSGGAKQGALLRQERMLDAANAGDLETLKVVLAKKTDTNFRDSHGDTALILAVRQGHRDAVEALLEHGADVEMRDGKENKTALMWANLREDKEIVKLLLQKGANPQAATKDGKTPFSVAASKGDKEMLSSFFKEGRKIDTASLNKAFLQAAIDGRTEVAESLIDGGADVNAKGILGQTALFSASTPKFVKLLLEKGADVNALDEDGSTPLMVAIREGRTELTGILTENGANINSTTKDGQTPLMMASLKGYTEIVRDLVEKGAHVNARDKDGLTALSFPCAFGRIDLVKFLVERGADVNVKPSQGEGPVATAYHNGDIDMFKLLLEKGADPNSKGELRQPLLIVAYNKGDAATVKLLLEKGADPDSKGEQGQPLLIVAYNKGDAATVKLLLEKGADVKSTNQNGETVLMLAAAKGDAVMTRTLLEKGADVCSKDKEGNTVIVQRERLTSEG
ncbi:MAG: ankyrin repeat domain-containing protein [Desulfomonilaceae bacterium]